MASFLRERERESLAPWLPDSSIACRTAVGLEVILSVLCENARDRIAELGLFASQAALSVQLYCYLASQEKAEKGRHSLMVMLQCGRLAVARARPRSRLGQNCLLVAFQQNFDEILVLVAVENVLCFCLFRL